MNVALGIMALVLAFYLFGLLLEQMRRSSEEFQPRRNMKDHVSDEEFLAACSVKDPDVAFKVRAIISDQLDIPLNNIHPDDRFVQELGCW